MFMLTLSPQPIQAIAYPG